MAIHAVHRLEAHLSSSSKAEAQALDSIAAREWVGDAAAAGVAGVSGDSQMALGGMQARLAAELQSHEGQQQEQEQQQGQQEAEGNVEGQQGPSNVVKVIGLMPFLTGRLQRCSLIYKLWSYVWWDWLFISWIAAMK